VWIFIAASMTAFVMASVLIDGSQLPLFHTLSAEANTARRE
jgi:hypothetical protein